MLPILELGPVTLRTPGLALLAALWLGLEVASREGARRGLTEDRIYNLGFLAILGGVLGARLGYVLLHLPTYLTIRPILRIVTSVLALAPGTENIWAGLLIGVTVLISLVKWWQLDPISLADSFAPGISIFIAGIGLANLFSGDYYGIETNVFWGIVLWGAKRHPTQVYLTAIALISFVILQRFHGHAGNMLQGKHRLNSESNMQLLSPGLVTQVFVITISLGLLLIEPLRADSPVIGPGIRIWEIIALLGLVGTLGSFAYYPSALHPDTR